MELNNFERGPSTDAPSYKLGCIAQLVASLSADPGVGFLIPVQSQAFVEINHEVISTVNLLLLLIEEGLLSVTSESMCTKYWLTT